MNIDQLAEQVIQAIQGKPEAVSAITSALTSGSSTQVREALQAHAGISVSNEDVNTILARVHADPAAPAAYAS